jgi:hypothetical protein
MKWPPVPENGRLPMVEGARATATVVMLTLSDLQTNPFNDSRLSLGDVTFRPGSATRTRIDAALQRLKRTLSVEAIIEKVDTDGSAEYTVLFNDRETKTKAEVTVG